MRVRRLGAVQLRQDVGRTIGIEMKTARITRFVIAVRICIQRVVHAQQQMRATCRSATRRPARRSRRDRCRRSAHGTHVRTSDSEQAAHDAAANGRHKLASAKSIVRCACLANSTSPSPRSATIGDARRTGAHASANARAERGRGRTQTKQRRHEPWQQQSNVHANSIWLRPKSGSRLGATVAASRSRRLRQRRDSPGSQGSSCFGICMQRTAERRRIGDEEPPERPATPPIDRRADSLDGKFHGVNALAEILEARLIDVERGHDALASLVSLNRTSSV